VIIGPSDCGAIPDCNNRQFDKLRQDQKLHKEIFLHADKDFKGVDHDPL
jgi:hypothetical protein